MAVHNYKRFKILLSADSKKTQGLRCGDIVRRQYFDSQNIIYSLMCVLEDGTDEQDRKYFIGALLEGDEPKQEELLDFARITNLFDLDRSGALYLTSNDPTSPFMDVIDGVAQNKSLCFPFNIGITEAPNPKAQYIAHAPSLTIAEYIPFLEGHNRVCHYTRNTTAGTEAIGITQNFSEFVINPNRVLVSYKIKSSRNLTAKGVLQYVDETRVDGEVSVDVTTEWQYCLHAITVEHSGRHLRTFDILFEDTISGDEIWIADLNIILLSSVATFDTASRMRVGKLNGVVDPVFGTLSGYGGYVQKLYAAGSTHISGTLTAGDENGFGATFYAGKIHRNTFVNSTNVNFSTNIAIEQVVQNPTGVGGVYVIDVAKTMIAQTHDWLVRKTGKKYSFSFYAYAKQECQVLIYQNNHVVGSINIPYYQTHSWQRYNVTFELYAPNNSTEGCLLTISPTFVHNYEDDTNEDVLYFSAPQLESGEEATQYQPTDSVLNETDGYGAWFSAGGIGGTIQNPLIKLNFDGLGSIGARHDAFVIKIDGSGYLANKSIMWDANGNVRLSDKVTISWDNLSEEVQNQLWNCSIRLLGSDTFVKTGDVDGNVLYSPDMIVLTISEINFTSTSEQRNWYYMTADSQWIKMDYNGLSLEVRPTDSYFDIQNSVTFKVEVVVDDLVFADTKTIRKEHISGYTVAITSSQGTTFSNGRCNTVLSAQVLFQGLPVSQDFIDANFVFYWRKYILPNIEEEAEGWQNAIYDEDNNIVQPWIDRTAQSITVNCEMTTNELYTCELQTGTGFELTFPVTI